jgi:hypothetical protein
MTPHERAEQLLQDWALCQRAKPRKNAVDIQLYKDVIKPWAEYLSRQAAWGSEIEILEACNQFETRLKELKEKLIIEVLKNGAV